jgi:hypothetical protein
MKNKKQKINKKINKEQKIKNKKYGIKNEE